jgi:hypothetical protein
LHTDDRFRSSFLWGRKQMLAAVAARLRHQTDLVWVDLGGGTGVSFRSQIARYSLSLVGVQPITNAVDAKAQSAVGSILLL